MICHSVLLLAILGAAVAFSPSSFGGQQLARVQGTSTNTVSMKIYDWKNRQKNWKHIDEVEFTHTNLRPAPGSTKRHKRKGRGIAAGQGASCGFGMRGQKSRSGKSVRPGFEGGQTPLYRRIPKIRGRPMGPGHQKIEYALMQFNFLDGVEEGSTVNFESLRAAGKMPKQGKGTKHKRNSGNHQLIKVVGGRDLNTKGLTVQAHAFTASAKKAIEEAGGKCVVLSKTTNKPLEPVAA
eukprot:CAMPEP_0113934228 /NCGR_PEP_ID=MMETSP1339-20121228/1561_1 /TAXON_ID=94617 /ORGANISM="Fibrocapsa japonica" /LENGTH=236 /DNA_ID=CAMNT_0000935937 /DNA_START=78 /DNA_END=788 /DNA_ORIENTATION=+ /assembly_acc=CAM_ASM_000762